jgi:catechol 2,3-dioxygenase-like lactoylglutathione lyase family enzyme
MGALMAEQIQYNGGLTVSLPVSDLDAAVDWYQKVLGFELQYRLDDLGWCELISPVAKVNVGLSVVESPNPGGATPTFGVQDMSAAKASLQEQGVRIDGDIVTIEGMVSLLTFYDQDNNSLMLYQDLASND